MLISRNLFQNSIVAGEQVVTEQQQAKRPMICTHICTYASLSVPRSAKKHAVQ